MKKNVIPAVMLFGLIAVVAILLTLPGGGSLLRDIGVGIRWVSNLLLTILILVVFTVGPWLVGGLAWSLVNTMLERSGASWRWHWVFLVATAALLLLGWPYLIQGVVMTPADWTSRFFYRFANQSAGLMVFEVPPIWWGVYASAAGAVMYLIPVSEERDQEPRHMR